MLRAFNCDAVYNREKNSSEILLALAFTRGLLPKFGQTLARARARAHTHVSPTFFQKIPRKCHRATQTETRYPAHVVGAHRLGFLIINSADVFTRRVFDDPGTRIENSEKLSALGKQHSKSRRRIIFLTARYTALVCLPNRELNILNDRRSFSSMRQPRFHAIFATLAIHRFIDCRARIAERY